VQVYENLQLVAQKVVGYKDEAKYGGQVGLLDSNYGNSFLTMLSKSGFIFGIINIVGNFGTVFVDQSYWMSAIAAKPSATYKGYILGGLCWFAIPFTLATSLGLGARALDLPLSFSEAGEGMPLPTPALVTSHHAPLLLSITATVRLPNCGIFLPSATNCSYFAHR
jgi:urea-proton symporter